MSLLSLPGFFFDIDAVIVRVPNEPTLTLTYTPVIPTQTPVPSATATATITAYPTPTGEAAQGVQQTVYIGNYFEYQPGSGKITTYYYAGSARIALRVRQAADSGTPYYLLSDHLGSTSLVVDKTGSVVSETRYKAWGETRYNNGNSTLTDYGYTGQRKDRILDCSIMGHAGMTARYPDSLLRTR